ncbi:hypothetical protein [Tepidimicrobium xylanilyticum]|uniref:Uncharacterized protein n=1 Tax=Tepidimicrobium xylanilyticum TaxID=1123352 RepID=A0A1H3F457_9FIRM|nr:hypothetical protein [Tepidimicrobium xylanilyticum]SDX85813.1 hypothetical protein SAMN05660923_03064 [Tepidimicrobium xylanilyticum]
MSYEVNKYVARAVVRYLNGNKDLFYTYVRKAMKLYENEKCMVTLEDMLDKDTKTKLYELVS